MTVAAAGLVLLSGEASAQGLTHLWTGLQNKQSAETLPVGKAPVRFPQRKAKIDAESRLLPAGEGEWIISSGWELGTNTQLIESGQSIFSSSFNTSEWLNATVPGTVLTTLVDRGVYPDPYFGLNNLKIPDTLCRMDWWYRNAFDLPKDAGGGRVTLLFDGINYRAEVFLNGRKLGNVEGAFIRGEFDVTETVRRDSRNVLAVHILPPFNPGIPHEQSMIAGQGLNGGALSIDGPTFIASMGWDWIPGIRDRNIGIWRNVRLQTGESVRIVDPQVFTDLNLPDTASADVTVNVAVRNASKRDVEGRLTVSLENLRLERSYSLRAGETKIVAFSPATHPELRLKNPRLWWPNGYGRQELYGLEIRAFAGDKLSDSKRLRFGVREMSYELMASDSVRGNTRIAYTPRRGIKNSRPPFDYDRLTRFAKDVFLPSLSEGVTWDDFTLADPADPMGAFLVIRVNGVRIFCRGGNWGMDDAMKRSSRERLEPYLKLHRDMNFNIVRNWTGESTEDVFYDLCDEYGMLVWNDFWITTDDTVEPNDQPLFMRNATDVVRRFRNHPSIAVWCPRNEGFAPKGLSAPLAAMLAREDPTRHYHGQSCKLNMPTSGPWEYFEDPSRYFTQRATGFNSEMGTFAIPTARTIRKFIDSADLWPPNDVWAYHDLHHRSQNFKGFMATVARYGEAKGVDDFAAKAQFVTYDAWRSMLESWNSRMWNNTSGLILWMSHPAWPSMIWQTYTYDCETPGSYFGAKKACEPLHIQMNLPDGDIVVVNSTRNVHESLTATLRCLDVNGKELERGSARLRFAEANASIPAGLSFKGEGKSGLYLVRLELRDDKGSVLSVNDYWRTSDPSDYRQLDELRKADIRIVKRSSGNRTTVEVVNRSSKIAAGIKLNAVNPTTGEIILPAYFSDGYFNLLPGEKRTIRVSLDKDDGNYNVVAL